jgi:uncharacterized protein YjcR
VPRYGEFFTDEEVAEFLGTKENTVRAWCSRHGVERVTLMSAQDVRSAKDAMPGKGNGPRPRALKRTDADNSDGPGPAPACTAAWS